VEASEPDLVILNLALEGETDLRLFLSLHRILDMVPVLGLVEPDSTVLGRAIEAGLQDFLFTPLKAQELEHRLTLARRRLEVTKLYNQASGRMRDYSARLNLPTDFGLVAPVADILTRDLRAGGRMPADGVFQLRLTISELITNAMEHGSLAITLEEKLAALEEGRFDRLVEERLNNPELAGRTVDVATRHDNDRVTFSVQDQGPGFNVDEISARLSAPSPSLPCGRGLFLLRQLGDEYCFSQGGRKVTLVRYLRGNGRPPAGSEDPDSRS
jgi:anti-sigma regulatory factor (Ser/Thr protein kinase)